MDHIPATKEQETAVNEALGLTEFTMMFDKKLYDKLHENAMFIGMPVRAYIRRILIRELQIEGWDD